MLITDLSVRKMAEGDPRYPDQLPPPRGPFTEVFTMECTTDDGQHLECPFFWGPNFPLGEQTPDNFATMLKFFAKAISRIEPVGATA